MTLRSALCARHAPCTTCTRRTRCSAAASTASASCASTHMHIATGRREGAYTYERGSSISKSHAAFRCAGGKPSAATPPQRAEPGVNRALRAFCALRRATKWLAQTSAMAAMA
jgi:hypothetical protein